MSAAKTTQYKAYSAATHTVAKTRQIVMLYDGAIRFIKQAEAAIAEQRIEDRFRLLVRASEVMVGLQNCIDFENGGEIANTLHRFYTNMSTRILSVNLHPKQSLTMCEEIINDLKQMREVWDNIDRSLGKPEKAESPAPDVSSITLVSSGNVTLSA